MSRGKTESHRRERKGRGERMLREGRRKGRRKARIKELMECKRL
jgi:hypothetical protein